MNNGEKIQLFGRTLHLTLCRNRDPSTFKKRYGVSAAELKRAIFEGQQ